MKMGLYKLFSYNVEIQYKSYILSKAMMFTFLTTALTLILPFIVAYRSRGFWLKSTSFFEQPKVHFTYEYILVAETEDPSQPIVCGDAPVLDNQIRIGEENCAEIQVQEHDYNEDGKNDVLKLKFVLKVPPERTVASIMVMLALDFQIKNVCPLHMQSLAIVNRDFVVPSSGLEYFGDLQFYQVKHLPCYRHHIDTAYNISTFKYWRDSDESILDFVSQHYFSREVITEMKTLYSKSHNGHTGSFDLSLLIRIPELQVQYVPNLLQELKWAWPQYLSIALIFHWLFNKIKKFVFINRLVMAWEVVPWKRN